jgi:3-methyladenine DNA glycosylase AlkD
MTLSKVHIEIRSQADPKRAKSLSRFFKTGKGQYGQGDKFLGLTVPQSRSIAKKYLDINRTDFAPLLKSKYHEERLIALLILNYKFEKATEDEQHKIFSFYLSNTRYVNNWDLVDSSAPYIVGNYLLNKDTSILYKLAKSDDLWEKRIAIVATLMFIKHNKLTDTLKISKILISDKHDLIHKAVGWSLRELGKKDQKLLENFLKENIRELPRTTLRYAIERFPEPKRKAYLMM